MQIMLVDDDDMSRSVVHEFLSFQLGHEVKQFASSQDAVTQFKDNNYDLVITDLKMPGLHGVDFIKTIRRKYNSSRAKFIVMTGYGDMQSSIEALKAGASDYLLKPVSAVALASVVESVEAEIAMQRNGDKPIIAADSVQAETHPLGESQPSFIELMQFGKIGFISNKMKQVYEFAKKLHSDRSIPVLIEGETGTGKEIMAQIVHGDEREIRPFISINCSSISPALFESEFFGYGEGSFTGARKTGMRGKLDQANGGTLFLDEIGDMPLDMQPKLLRVLQDRAFYPVGGDKQVQLDLRIICATKKNLEAMIQAGTFRADLYYRLNVGRIILPPLRERLEDIAPLTQMFMEKYSLKHQRRFKYIPMETIELMKNYPWPGNIRELMHALERIVFSYDDIELKPQYFDFINKSTGSISSDVVLFAGISLSLPLSGLDLKAFTSAIVDKTLEKFEGNKTKAAAYLGLTRSSLRSKI